jgi:prevent-host-death family protein
VTLEDDVSLLDVLRLVNKTGHMKTMNASEFKAKCLAILDEVAETGEALTILKHGKPVAQLVPPTARSSGFPQEALVGSIEHVGDVISPAVDASTWEAEDAEVGPD